MPLTALGVYGQSLHDLNFLIAEQTIEVAVTYRSGVLVQDFAPRAFRCPYNWSSRIGARKDPESLKSTKDRSQAAFLIDVLEEDRPDDLAEAYEDVVSRGPAGRSGFWQHEAACLDTRK